ncbi:hypothetical protein KY290_013699 [Solanum tuberosum]|uniref:Uncharacterized protein n=1 Tax=Solanum tuberosum TaxID=4113 RepID=A0ABQ7VMP8_SOLTU|nr:hypothetical protein KY289_013815 [Solanum tuberosum]KAH0769718.1 hypothetical protein KY290_013699 [Solanum tuberosum]
MAEALAIAVGKYTYVHEVGKGPPEAIDAHHIVVRRSREKGKARYSSSLELSYHGIAHEL